MDLLKGLADRIRGPVVGRDARGARVVLVAHCVLNQNARVAGAAVRPAALTELVAGLFARDVGIVQMPCPEVAAFGLDRADLCIEHELRTSAGRALCRKLAREQLWQIRAYQAAGVRVLGVLGKNGSPSCGVEETWRGRVCPGSGAFIQALEAELRSQGLAVGIAGIADGEPARALAVVDRWISADGA